MTAKEYILTLPERTGSNTIDESLESSFNFDLEGEEGGQFAVLIKDGKVEVRESLYDGAKCQVGGKADSFMKVVNKELNPMMALLTGKIKVSDKSELIKFAKVLGIMK